MALEGRLDAILSGNEIPKDSPGKIDVAEVCRVKSRFAAAAQFYREAFLVTPALADDLKSQHQLYAAIAAARAGTDQKRANGDATLDEAQRSRWREQALDWLRHITKACDKSLLRGPERNGVLVLGKESLIKDSNRQHALARKTLEVLIHHRDLACVREEGPTYATSRR